MKIELLRSRLEDALGAAFCELEVTNPEVASDLQEVGVEILEYLERQE